MANQQFAKTANRKKKNYKLRGKGLTKKQKLQISKMIEDPVEKKYYDTSYDTVNVLLTPTVVDLTSPAEGTGSDQLIGSSLQLQSIQYRFAFTRGDDTNYVRYLIFQWRPDSQHDLPSWNQMFQYHTAGFPISLVDIMSPYQLGEGGTNNFKILVDEQFYIDADNPIQIVKGFINKGFTKSIECNGSIQQGTNHIFLMFLSDSSMTSHPNISGYTRIRFTDS